MIQSNSSPSAATMGENDRKARAAALMAMAGNMALPASSRLAAVEFAEMLLRDADDGPIPFAIDAASDIRETYWSIVLACMNAVIDRTTSARHAQRVVGVAADSYRVILETRIEVRRAEAEFAPRIHSAVLRLEAALALQAQAEERGRHGA